jgi:uncharacterized BrkB/YihY/UPF0761 family membrane protein
MSSFYIIIIIGSITLTKKFRELFTSIKQKRKEKITIDIFSIFLVVLLIVTLFSMKYYFLNDSKP